jgi:negative regulator of genetic competence, sporulation and motility
MFEHIVIDNNGEKDFKNRGLFLMELFAECDELEVFTTKGIIDNIEFKWDQFAKAFHLIGCFMHFAYMFLLFVYIG